MTAVAAGRADTRRQVRPQLRPQVRHGVLAAALLVVAALRLTGGDHLWAAVLGVAGLAELYLSRRATPAAAAPAARPMVAERPEPDVLDRSLRARRQALRLWTGLLVLTSLTAVVVLTAAPPLAVVVAALSLGCLLRVRRERRSVAVLERLTGEVSA
jgi:hypothetical protein